MCVFNMRKKKQEQNNELHQELDKFTAILSLSLLTSETVQSVLLIAWGGHCQAIISLCVCGVVGVFVRET